jgi:hypothetical protein
MPGVYVLTSGNIFAVCVYRNAYSARTTSHETIEAARKWAIVVAGYLKMDVFESMDSAY